MSAVEEEAFTAEQEAVARANERFYQAIEDGDLDAMRAVWVGPAQGHIAHCVHPGQPAVHGLSQILMSWALVMSRLTYLQFFITDVRVIVDGDVAVATCAENVLTDLPHAEDSDGSGFAGGRAEATNVFRRDASGRWLMFAHHSSPVFPSGAESPDEPD